MIAALPVAARYMLLSALGFALMAACVKAVALKGIPVLEIVAARAAVSLLLSYADVRRKGISPWGHERGLLLARGAVGALALLCVYYAITVLPLAEATLLQYTHPLFTALLALWFLGERLRLPTLVCTLLSLLGLALMLAPELRAGALTRLPLFGVLVALLGAFGSAVAYVLVRRLSRSEDSSVIIFYFPLIALPLSLLLLGREFVMPDGEALLLLLLVGVFTQVGQVGLTLAMRAEEAGKASAYAYAQVVFAAVLGWVWFEELPTFWTLVGGSLIVAGMLINGLWRR